MNTKHWVSDNAEAKSADVLLELFRITRRYDNFLTSSMHPPQMLEQLIDCN